MPIPLLFAAAALAADLPVGNAPVPVAIPHFPTRFHAYVWRNWTLVPIDRIAKAVDASRAEILRTGKAMGLPNPPKIPPDQERRSYLTVIRRNWHLLPYDQLLRLLNWKEEELAYTLREDDFLYIKLGSHKPKCDPIRSAPPDERTTAREREIARIVREYFPQGVLSKEPLFTFVRDLTKPPPVPNTQHPTPNTQHPTPEPLRFCYSYFALYGDPLLDGAPDPYPDGYLARLKQAGVNGVWLQAVLYKLAPFPWDYDLSARYEERLWNLRKLVDRAKRHGIRVFLYLNEPRALPLYFFLNRRDLKGVTEGDHAAMCTSVPRIQKYLTQSVASIARAVPELGGFFTITASENFTNCWSHHNGAACPRCGKRNPAEVIAEVNRLIQDGIDASGYKARLIAWDWGWADSWAPNAIRALPAGVSLMSVSEWSLPIERGGVKSTVGEYSISSVGPGPRALKHWAIARARGLPVIAKIQASNSWELSSVPYIPALNLVAQHAANLREQKVDGIMLGWTLGGYPSPNLEVVAEVMRGTNKWTAIEAVAERRFGDHMAGYVREAWKGYSREFREFPFHIGTVYTAPMQFGPSNLFWETPTRYPATMIGFPYDDLNTWRAIYPPSVLEEQLHRVGIGFERPRRELQERMDVSRQSGVDTLAPVESEVRVGETAELHFKSAANQCKFINLRDDRLPKAKDSAATRSAPSALERVIEDELSLATRLHALQTIDSRIGFEASNHYYYVPLDLVEKVLNCRDLLDRWIPEMRKR